MDQTIKLDTRKRVSEVQIAPLRRGERNNALLTVRICANGQPYDLTGKTASLVATTAAGKLVGPCPMEVAEAGAARIMLPAALYSAVGVFSGYVEIRDGEALVDTTDRFGGKVLECPTSMQSKLQNSHLSSATWSKPWRTRSEPQSKRMRQRPIRRASGNPIRGRSGTLLQTNMSIRVWPREEHRVFRVNLAPKATKAQQAQLAHLAAMPQPRTCA